MLLVRFVTFQVGTVLRLGAVQGEQVVDLANAGQAALSLMAEQAAAPEGEGANGPGAAAQEAVAQMQHLAVALRSLRLLLSFGEAGLDLARQVQEFALQRADPAWLRPLASVLLRAPILSARKVLVVDGNFGAVAGLPAPPQLFLKPPTTLVGPGEAVVVPDTLFPGAVCQGALAVVIGRPCKEVTPDEAQQCIAGYCNFADITALGDLSESPEGPSGASERAEWLGWLSRKWLDTTGPIGPMLVTPDELPDLDGRVLETRLNGAVVQRARVGELIHPVGELVAWLSETLRLEPGDIVACGSPPFTPGAFPVALPGDTLEVEVAGLGVLRNRLLGRREPGAAVPAAEHESAS